MYTDKLPIRRSHMTPASTIPAVTPISPQSTLQTPTARRAEDGDGVDSGMGRVLVWREERDQGGENCFESLFFMTVEPIAKTNGSGGAGELVRLWVWGESGTHLGKGADNEENTCVGVVAHTQRHEDGKRDGDVEDEMHAAKAHRCWVNADKVGKASPNEPCGCMRRAKGGLQRWRWGENRRIAWGSRVGGKRRARMARGGSRRVSDRGQGWVGQRRGGYLSPLSLKCFVRHISIFEV
ncbi:hypothetical protein K439DRAFT_1625063 [Ramaria rubella]|nr:hypothetical protein K439DRAFT_1625063 [Ramaria rubella]